MTWVAELFVNQRGEVEMSLERCRECNREVSTEATVCPHCGAPYPTRKEWKGWGIDWKSKTTVYGYPLVHVSFGRDARGRLRVAKGIIAIGQFAIGVIAIGQLGIGILFGFGQVMFGLTAVAQFAIAALFGGGQFSTGYFAVGQFAIGCYAFAQAGIAQHFYKIGESGMTLGEFLGMIGGKLGLTWGR